MPNFLVVRYLCVTLAISALAGCVETGPSQAPAGGAAGSQANEQTARLPFASLAGTWTGTQLQADGSSRPMTITFGDDGRYTWVSGGRTLTTGRLSGSVDAAGYNNAAGSRGTVTVAGNTMTWRNTFTGNNYVVTVTR